MKHLKSLSFWIMLGILMPSLAGAQTVPPANTTQGTISYNHCKVYSGVGADCPGRTAANAISDNTSNWSAQAGKGSAVTAIDLYNTCRWVDGANGNMSDVFVPFKTDQEWGAFIAAAGTSESAPSKYVTLAHCARPGVVGVPPNDPALDPSTPETDVTSRCYNKDGTLQIPTQPFTKVAYGRAGDKLVVNPIGISFACYTAQGEGPWTKTVTSAELQGYSADRSVGSSISRANSDWGVLSVVYQASPMNGVCGSTVNGQTLASAPSGGELCNSGTPSTVSGSGPWTWTCQGYNGGTDSATCTANNSPPACPAAVAYSDISSLDVTTAPIMGGNTYLTFTGMTGQIDVPASSHITNSSATMTSYFSGKCAAELDYYWADSNTFANVLTTTTWGKSQQETAYYTLDQISLMETNPAAFNAALAQSPTALDLYNPVYNSFISCIANEYARENFPTYANCTSNAVSGDAASPLKVNLAGGDAVMNSATPTSFYLTLKDGRTLEGHVKGGLNPDEGWLMVHRSDDPLVFENGALNANDWFGDRDHRSLNGYTDLAETFKDFVIKDEFGQRFVPLHSLTNDEKKTKALAKGDGAITNPSLDLRVIDAAGAEHLASDFFDRIYVDYRNVVEGDGPDGKGGDNIILERGIVRTLAGENHGAVDQWFILDVPADYGPVDHPTQSKVLPAAR